MAELGQRRGMLPGESAAPKTSWPSGALAITKGGLCHLPAGMNPEVFYLLFIAGGTCRLESIRGVVPDSIIGVSSRGARRYSGGRHWPDVGLVTIGQIYFLAWEYLVDVRYLRIGLYKRIEGIAGTKMLKR